MNFKEILALPVERQRAILKSMDTQALLSLAKEGLEEVDNNWDEVFAIAEANAEKRLETDTASKEATVAALTQIMSKG